MHLRCRRRHDQQLLHRWRQGSRPGPGRGVVGPGCAAENAGVCGAWGGEECGGMTAATYEG